LQRLNISAQLRHTKLCGSVSAFCRSHQAPVPQRDMGLAGIARQQPLLNAGTGLCHLCNHLRMLQPDQPNRTPRAATVPLDKIAVFTDFGVTGGGQRHKRCSVPARQATSANKKQ
jgi:hypothetical protein